MSQKRIAIAGGGIAGLTVAIALQRKGFDVTVYEQAPQIKPLGAGLALAANAVKALIEIGVGDDVLRAGKVIKAMYIKDEKGNVLTESDSERISAKLGVVNNFTIHRADLHQILINQLTAGTVVLNKSCIDFDQKSSGLSIKFSDGTSAFANYLIACDGIHSAIRKKLLPESLPRYAGYTCWRSVIDEIPASVNMNETSESWGPGSRFGIVPLLDNRIYWFATINAKANDPVMRRAKVPDLLNYFGNFHDPVTEILKKTKDDKLIWSDIIDIKPIKKFAFGNIVLIGDAAHATTPNMGQGACMAIEDAAVLANCLENYSSPEEAFVQFEKKRIPRTTKIVNASWNFGRIAQWENPVMMKIRNAAVRLTPPSLAEKQLKFLTDVSFN